MSAEGEARSVLLQCLSQLNSDVWAQVLLPKLVEQGSAAAVALTCSQLRDLCYSSIEIVNLRSLQQGMDYFQVKSCVESLPMHFPNCTSVSVELSPAQSCLAMEHIQPAIARLPRFNRLCINVPHAGTHSLMLLALTLVSTPMRQHLPMLQRLIVCLTHPTADWFDSEHVHKELGKITQLTQLCVNFHHLPIEDAGVYDAVHHLSSLRHLQHLAFWADDWVGDEHMERFDGVAGFPILPQQLLSSLTALTRLESNLFDVESLEAVSSCVNLQHLSVCLEQHFESTAQQQWAALTPLTRLTELRLLNAYIKTASPQACETLKGLSRLQCMGVGLLGPTFVPALTECLQLTEICGEWAQSSECVEAVLPQVRVLSGAAGDAPFGCFPQLSHLHADTYVDGVPAIWSLITHPSYLQSMCKYCTDLRDLDLKASQQTLCPMDSQGRAYTSRVRAEAIQYLTSLQQLTCLKFTPSDSFELLSLVQACCVLEGHSLQELHVTQGNILPHFSVRPAAWMQLGELRHLQHLSVELTCEQTCACLADEALVLLSALRHCGSVTLTVTGLTVLFEAALAALREAGMPTPRVEVHVAQGVD